MAKNITIRYGVDTLTENVLDTTTVGQLTSDASIKARLGCGDSIKVTLNGVELPSDAVVPNGANLVFETKCNTKAQDNQMVNVRYGVDTLSRSFRHGVTVGEVVQDRNVKAGLGFGDSIKVTLNGIQLPTEAVVPNGATLVVETACNTKAS